LYDESATLEMNKFTEIECLPNYGLKFKFLENISKPLTLKIKNEKIHWNKQQNGRDKEGKPKDRSCREKPNKYHKRKPNVSMLKKVKCLV